MPLSNLNVFQKEHLEMLSARPNTTVMTPEFTGVHEAWSADTVKRVLLKISKIVKRLLEETPNIDNFRLRKMCILEDEEILSFQRTHPNFFDIVTDMKMVQDPSYFRGVQAMLSVREKVDNGTVSEGADADAMAASAVMAALGVSVPVQPRK
jgi:hypothetical protein